MSTYNGWTNHETWCVHLWLSNEEGTYRTCREFARTAKREAPTCSQVREKIWPRSRATVFLLADAIKGFVSESNPLTESASVFSDLITSALCEVNWHEIAEAFLED